MSVAAQDGAAVLPVNQRQIMGAVVASCMGWALDLFDLFVLLYVAPVVGRLFFPSEHAMLSLAAVYASFAVTLLMRPLGSALFGSYADRHGRKGAMIVAVVTPMMIGHRATEPTPIRMPEANPAAGQKTATPSGCASSARLSRAARK